MMRVGIGQTVQMAFASFAWVPVVAADMEDGKQLAPPAELTAADPRTSRADGGPRGWS